MQEGQKKLTNILIADDNQINRVVIKKMLSQFSVILDFVENGEEAVEKVKSKIYDIVLMDIYMPVLDGLEATKKIRDMEDIYFKELPIIALTASVMENDINSIYENGLNDYQVKPFKLNELVEKINKYILLEDRIV